MDTLDKLKEIVNLHIQNNLYSIYNVNGGYKDPYVKFFLKILNHIQSLGTDIHLESLGIDKNKPIYCNIHEAIYEFSSTDRFEQGLIQSAEGTYFIVLNNTLENSEDKFEYTDFRLLIRIYKISYESWPYYIKKDFFEKNQSNITYVYCLNINFEFKKNHYVDITKIPD